MKRITVLFHAAAFTIGLLGATPAYAANTTPHNAAEAAVKTAYPESGYYWALPCKLLATATVGKTVHMSLPWTVPTGGPNSGYYSSTCSYYKSMGQAEPNVDIGLQENQEEAPWERGTPEPTVGPTARCVYTGSLATEGYSEVAVWLGLGFVLQVNVSLPNLKHTSCAPAVALAKLALRKL